MIDKLITACQLARFNLKAIDIDVFALTRLRHFLLIDKQNHCVAIALIQNKNILFCVIHKDQLLYTIKIDSPNPITNIQRALQFYQQANSNYVINHIYLIGTTIPKNNIELQQTIVRSQFNANIITVHPFDERLWLSFSLATWGLIE